MAARQTAIVFKDRTFTPRDLSLIRELVSSCSRLSRLELANTVCELLGWRRANGGLKTWECRELLAELESAGELQLPPLRTGRPRGARTSVPRTAEGEPREALRGTLEDVAPVSLELVVAREERRLWRELVGRYHYLGHAVPFGAHLRYLIAVSRPTRQVVGCVQLSSPAWKMAARDRWIGWSDDQRRRNLQRIVNNSRFLLLPWVEVRYLASSVLSLVAREFPSVWEAAYGVQPLLLETLVETGRYPGTCYRAANWIELGTTRGRGRMDREKKREGACTKTVFVCPLVKGARELLCGEER
jgi:hypothetical protein